MNLGSGTSSARGFVGGKKLHGAAVSDDVFAFDGTAAGAQA
jgi:hypothetical protein